MKIFKHGMRISMFTPPASGSCLTLSKNFEGNKKAVTGHRNTTVKHFQLIRPAGASPDTAMKMWILL